MVYGTFFLIMIIKKYYVFIFHNIFKVNMFQFIKKIKSIRDDCTN